MSLFLLLETFSIAARCDICLLQDVTDPDGSAIRSLLSSLNRETNRYEDYTYKAVSSKSLGKSPTDLQKYVFIYRTETVNVTDQHQYQNKDFFVRRPFVVKFHSKKTEIKDFILVPLHSDPGKAVQEIDRLYDVFQEVSKKWNNTVLEVSDHLPVEVRLKSSALLLQATPLLFLLSAAATAPFLRSAL
eukprot:superscaffoldBa00004408_g18832